MSKNEPNTPNPYAAIDRAISLNETVLNLFSETDSLQKICGVTLEQMQKYRGIAKQFHQEKRYSLAADAFLFLATLAPGDVDFWIGLGAAEQLLDRHDDALRALGVAALISPSDPNIHLLAAESLLSQGRSREAAVSLQTAREILKGGAESVKRGDCMNRMRATLQKLIDRGG